MRHIVLAALPVCVMGLSSRHASQDNSCAKAGIEA
jgi:hypothetical protein